MRKERRHFTPEEKVAILRRYLVDKVPDSELCEELGLRPTVFYRWQKELSENGAAAFQSQGRPPPPSRGEAERLPEQCHRLHHSKGHARWAPAGDSSRARSEVGSGEGTAEESPPGGGVMDETDAPVSRQCRINTAAKLSI
jgi:transposase-like protein